MLEFYYGIETVVIFYAQPIFEIGSCSHDGYIFGSDGTHYAQGKDGQLYFPLTPDGIPIVFSAGNPTSSQTQEHVSGGQEKRANGPAGQQHAAAF